MPTDLLVIGAGGHAKVVLDSVWIDNPDRLIRLIDDDPVKQGTQLLPGIVVESVDILERQAGGYHVAIGNNHIRRRYSGRLEATGRTAVTVMHESASVSDYADINSGSFIAAGAVVAPGACVGKGVIVNHRAVVDHDCDIGDFAHIAPGSTLGGGVKVGQNVLIGAGATILPMVSIADNAIIGAGAVVTSDVGEGMTFTGVPARRRD
ncbi:acetyltransferase [Marinobacterium jannaschii]|uniref:acetyltransferase n=1 Tax=Marinobacterium jannaschii TaxID=64970 RepID=UPI00047F8C42|nr:acetyltransferase [Marinobacterium jannaschii]